MNAPAAAIIIVGNLLTSNEDRSGERGEWLRRQIIIYPRPAYIVCKRNKMSLKKYEYPACLYFLPFFKAADQTGIDFSFYCLGLVIHLGLRSDAA